MVHADKSRQANAIPLLCDYGLVFVPNKDFDEDFTFTIVNPANRERFVLSPNNSPLKI